MTETTGSSGSATHRQALELARSAPTQHVPRLVTSREISRLIYGAGTVGKFNNRLALVITRGVGSMWAAYLFVLIAMVSFPQAWAAFVSGDHLTGITWLSQSLLQLVLLPFIMVGQQVISGAQDARAETDHET